MKKSLQFALLLCFLIIASKAENILLLSEFKEQDFKDKNFICDE